jgi:hypothetical protein
LKSLWQTKAGFVWKEEKVETGRRKVSFEDEPRVAKRPRTDKVGSSSEETEVGDSSEETELGKVMTSVTSENGSMQSN